MFSNQYFIDDNQSESLFCWYVKNDDETTNAPLIIWLNGGPGASSLEGLFVEKIGPFYMDLNTGKFYKNEQSWSKFADLLFVDNPIGVGFSKTKDQYIKSEKEMAKDFVKFLIAFLSDQDIFNKEIQIAGESQAGKYIPYISKEIQIQNKGSSEFSLIKKIFIKINNNNQKDSIDIKPKLYSKINLKAIFLGNGWQSPVDQYSSVPIYAFNKGFIDQKKMLDLNIKYHKCIKLIRNNKFIKAFQKCENIETDLYKKLGIFSQDTSLTHDIFIKSTQLMSDYLNSPPVKQSLDIAADNTWTSLDESGPVSDNLKADVEFNINQLLDDLIDSGLNLVMQNGMRDGTSCNHMANENVLRRLQSKTARHLSGMRFEEWVVDGRVEGQRKEWLNLQFVKVVHSGHFVPMMQPGLMRDQVESQILGKKDKGKENTNLM